MESQSIRPSDTEKKSLLTNNRRWVLYQARDLLANWYQSFVKWFFRLRLVLVTSLFSQIFRNITGRLLVNMKRDKIGEKIDKTAFNETIFACNFHSSKNLVKMRRGKIGEALGKTLLLVKVGTIFRCDFH